MVNKYITANLPKPKLSDRTEAPFEQGVKFYNDAVKAVGKKKC